MLRQRGGKPTELEFVFIDALVPRDHLLRRIERAVDSSFIREKVTWLYCADNGRPANDPVGLDSEYNAAPICKSLEERRIFGVMARWRPPHRNGLFYERGYRHDRLADQYLCPAGQMLRYSTTNHLGYRKYKSDGDQCANCPLLERCTQSANHVKVLTRTDGNAARNGSVMTAACSVARPSISPAKRP